MDSLSCTYNKQEIAPEPKNLEELNSELNKQKIDQSSKYLLFSCHHHSLKTVRITCEGNLHEPNFPRKLQKLISKLKALVSNENKQIKVINVEPWNSVRVTFNLSHDAAQRLRQLAELGDANLRELGILSVQIEGQQIISLRLANQHATNNNIIDQVSVASDEANNNSIVNSNNPEELHLKKPNQNELNHEPNKYLFGQVNGGIIDDSSNSSSNNSNVEQSQISDNKKPKTSSINFGSIQNNATKNVHQPQSMATSSVSFPPPYTSVPCQQPQVYFSQQPRANNSLHIASNQLNSNVHSQAKSNFLSHSTNTSNSSSEVSVSDSNLSVKKAETNSGLVQNANTVPVMVQQVRVQNIPFSTGEPSLMAVNTQKQFSNRSPSFALNRASIRNVNSFQFNGPRPLLISSTQSPKTFISSQTTVPLVSKLQSQSQPNKTLNVSIPAASESSVTVSEQSIKQPLQQPRYNNASYVNSSTFTSNSMALYAPNSTSIFSQPSTSAESEPKTKSFNENQMNTSGLNSQPNSGDILGSSVDGVDDEDLLASVTGANSIDLNNFTELNDLNLLSMLEEMESANHNTSQASTTSTLDTVSTTSLNDSNQINDSSKITTTTTTAVNVKNEEFRSPNVVAPQSTQPLPFFISQQSQQQQQSSTNVGTNVVSGAKQIMINSSTGAVLSQPQAHQLTQQIMAASTSTAVVSTSLPTSSTLYPFTSMQHASLFTAKQQPQPQQPTVPSSPRHVYLPVRQIPAVRAAASQQVQQQNQAIVRAMQPTVANSTTDQIVQHSPQQTNLYRPSNPLIRQPLSSNTSNSANSVPSPIQNKSQQQQLVIRQSVPYSTSQQSTPPPTGQQNTVALSSPLLVNLLQSDVQQSNPLQQNLQQHQQFVAQPGTQQIRLIQPGSHGDGTQVMMMVRVSQAPQGTTTQLINPATFVGAMSSSQVVTSIASHVMDQKANTSQSIDSSSNNVTNTKAKKPRKPRKTKNQADNKAENSVQTGIATSIQQVATAISSCGAITSIPLSLATSSPSRTQTSSVSTILSFPTSSLTQTFKLQATPSKQQQTILSGQTSTVAQHLFNQKQRVQPVVMIATSNANLSDVANVSSSNTISTSKNAFIITNVAASSLGTSTNANITSSTTTTSAGVQLSGKRKRILLATKSNSFPVSSALSAGAIMARVSNNSTSSSSTLSSAPVKLVSQSSIPQSSVPYVNISSSLPCLSTSESSFISVSSNSSECKSSLASIMSSSVCSSANLTNLSTTLATSIPNITSVSNSDLTSITQLHSLPTTSAITVNSPIKMSKSSTLSSQDSLSMSSGTQPMIGATNMFVKGYQIPSSVSANSNNSLLFSKLNQSTSSTCKILASSFQQMSNKSPIKTIAVPVSQLPPAFQKQMLALTEEKNKERNLSASNTADSITNHPLEPKISKCVSLESLLTSTESKHSTLTKSVSEAGFKHSLTDVLGSSSLSSSSSIVSKLDPVFLSSDDDPDRIAEPEAPISPSYFLAPPSAFENKQNVDDASTVQSEIKNEPRDSTNYKNNLFCASSTEQQKIKEYDSNLLLKLEQVSQTTTPSADSLTTSSVITEQSRTTITTTSAIKSSTTVTTPVKSSHDDVQTKSNCSYDSFSYFMSKHSYSQDLPDHILEDDEDGDDSDNDDFGLYPKSSHFLSGSVGSIGRNNSLALSSSSATPVLNINTSSNVSSLSVGSSSIFTDHRASLDNKTQIDDKPNINHHVSDIKLKTEAFFTPKDLNENKVSDINLIDKSVLIKDATILRTNENNSQHIIQPDIQTLMNGDIFQSSKNEQDTVDSNNSKVVQVSHCLTSITCNSLDSNTDSSAKQFPTINIVASKSYPLLNVATKNNTINTTQNQNESLISYSEPTLLTDKLSNLSENQSLSGEIQTNVSELSQNPSKKSRKSILPSQSFSTKSALPNKSRRKPVTSVSTMSQTIAVSDSLFQAQSTSTKSELHSLLASPTISAKPNVSLDSVSSSSLNETLSNLPTSSECLSSNPQRQVFYTFKQPNQTINTNSCQTIANQTSDSTSTQAQASTTFLKMLMPGVNNMAGNKLLTIATASSGANCSSNSNTASAQALTSTIASQNSTESTSSQKTTMTSVFGRYYVSGPSGSQLVVFKPVMMNDTRNATSSAALSSSQLKFTALPSKFSSVPGSNNSQPLIIPMVTSSTGQTILSMQPDTQAISTLESPSSSSSALNENEPKKFIARKTNAPNSYQSIIPLESNVLQQQPNFTQQQIYVSQSNSLEVSNADIKHDSSLQNVAVLDANDNLNGSTNELSKSNEDNDNKSLPDTLPNKSSNENQSVSSFLSSVSMNNPSSNVSGIKATSSIELSEKVLNQTDTDFNCDEKKSDNFQHFSKQQIFSESTTKTSTSIDLNETLNDHSLAKKEAPNVSHRVENKPAVLPSIELTTATTSVPTNSVVALRTDTTRLKESEKEMSGLNVNSRSGSPVGTRRPILIAKSTVGLHSQVSQLQTSQDLISNAIFATKSSGVTVTATKTLPTILRQSKRKADNFYQTSQSILTSSEQTNKMSQQNVDYQVSSDFSESSELENSAITSMALKPSKPSFRQHAQPISSEQNYSAPSIEFIDETSDHTVSDQMATRPRKRARKSKVTTIQQPANAGDLSTSLLLNDYNDMTIEISDDKADISEIEIKRSTTPTSSRVLRNSSAISTPTKSVKRGQRNNRSMLAHNSMAINISAAPSSPVMLSLDSINICNSLSKLNDKSKKEQEISSKTGSRQTRSNRNKIKKLEPSMISDSNQEIIISDNAVDEQLQLDISTSDTEFITSLTTENSHETMASSSASVTSSSLNQQVNTNTNATDQRSISILDSGNSNSSTASSNSSSNSLLIKRARKSLSASATKPSLRSNSASETLSSPITPSKRRRITKETAK